jgi:hypothetical protein
MRIANRASFAPGDRRKKPLLLRLVAVSQQADGLLALRDPVRRHRRARRRTSSVIA